MLAITPFESEDEMKATADKVWAELSREDWLEAFAAHPAIGGQAKTKWSQDEQKGTQGASMETMRACG